MDKLSFILIFIILCFTEGIMIILILDRESTIIPSMVLFGTLFIVSLVASLIVKSM